MVIYGVSGQQSISKMFMAGVIPGILVAIGLCVMHFLLCRNLKAGGLDWSMKAFVHSLRDGFWSILAPVIILGGIYAGIFTPTEAAVVAIFYTIIVGIFIHKELTFRSFMASLKTTSWLTGRVLVLVFTATAFGYLLTSYRIPIEIANWILSFTNNVHLVWFFVVILLLFLGMFMETLAIIMLVTPVLLPIMTAYGVDPIHFGIILICCCGIGFSTPPLGVHRLGHRQYLPRRDIPQGPASGGEQHPRHHHSGSLPGYYALPAQPHGHGAGVAADGGAGAPPFL